MPDRVRKVTDDARILVGYAVAFHWYGTERPRFSTDRIDHPDGRWRNVAHTACRRLYSAGLIANAGYSRSCDYGDWSEPYRMTEAGPPATWPTSLMRGCSPQ
jgi:hypothetical protein